MAQRPVVSVVMIAYNQEAVISNAIKGVVKQKTDFPIELIIVNDASTDGTLDVAMQWQRRYPDIIKVFTNPANLGIQANYIEAFRHCTGRYLAMCDADDYWIYSRKLATQVDYMERHPDCAITFHRVINHYEADGSKSLSNGGQTVDTDITHLSRANYITNLSVLYRHDCVDLGKLPEWTLRHPLLDYTIHMLYAAHGKIHYFSRPMGVYRIGASGTWSNAERYRRLGMSLAVREDLIREFSDRPEVVEGLRQASANILLHMLIAAGDDTSLQRETRDKLHLIPAYSSDEAIDIAVARISAARPPLKKRILTPLRALLSRLVPLPKP